MKNFGIIILCSVISVVSSCGQNAPDKIAKLVKDEGVTIPIHKENIGKIAFTTKAIKLEEYTPSDFISSIEIGENSELLIRVFLENSLTNYLHKLEPTLTADALLDNGNYQFSFFVDEDLIYKEDLNTGAGGAPSYKKSSTTIHVPLVSSIYTDFWSRFLWSRFLSKGGENALENGFHKVRIEIRTYLNHNGVKKISDLIAEGEITIKLAEPIEVSEQQIAIQPIQPNSGWKLSDDSYDKEKIRALNEKIAQQKFKNITSIVVIKEGKLLLEEYFNNTKRSTLHNTRSVGKTFASTLAGIAIKDGHLKSIDQTLKEFYTLDQFSNYSSRKGDVTLKSLLTMSSGFDGSDSNPESSGNEENMYPTDNWVKFTLDLPMDKTKRIGENWDYFTAGVVVLGDIIHKSVPGGLEKYAEKKLFKPMGISNYKWSYTPQKVANTAGGIQMNALDFAKYGQLYKNQGVWNGKQVLPRHWVKESLTNYFNKPSDQTGYGFLFWENKYDANGKTYEVFQCNGNGGNKVIIFNDQPLVIVITATAYGQPYAHAQVDKMIQDYILPAVLD